MKINERHPSLAAEFRKGRFGIKRTLKNFSKTLIDLTLELTINADAASQRTGVSAFPNLISARRRWVQSHFLRMSVVSHLLESLDLNKKEDVTADLQKNKKRKNAEALKSICQHIENTINPFSTDVDPNCLLNIETGRAASEETVAFYSMCRKQEMHTERSS